MSNEAVDVVALQIKAWYRKGLSCLPREGYAVRAYIWLMAKSIKVDPPSATVMNKLPG